jgi:flagellin
MSLRINTNVAAMNSQRILGKTQAELDKTIGRLSSGFRINRAGDDAAGLGIANQLHADQRAQSQAARNAEQASSVLSVMEGGAQTVESMLERMKELATQAASDNTDAGGRTRIQQEWNALVSEIDRAVQTTTFSGNVLLNGSFGNGVNASSTVLAAGTRVYSVDLNGAAAATYTVANGVAGSITITQGTSSQTIAVGSNGKQAVNFSTFGLTLNLDSNYAAAGTAVAGNLTVAAGTSGGSFMVSSSGNYTTSDNVGLSTVDLRASTATALNLGGLVLDTNGSAGAQTVLAYIDTALAKVATALGQIGASQNRIEYAFNNVKAIVNNYAAAESVIRDADMAEEMSKFSKSQILSQAGTAMLAQANQSAQGVLQLPRG